MRRENNNDYVINAANELKKHGAFNAYEYLLMNNEKVCLVNLPVDLPDTLYTWAFGGQRIILINEKANVSEDGLNRALTEEIAKIHLNEYADYESICLFADTLLSVPDSVSIPWASGGRL